MPAKRSVKILLLFNKWKIMTCTVLMVLRELHRRFWRPDSREELDSLGIKWSALFLDMLMSRGSDGCFFYHLFSAGNIFVSVWYPFVRKILKCCQHAVVRKAASLVLGRDDWCVWFFAMIHLDVVVNAAVHLTSQYFFLYVIVVVLYEHIRWFCSD